MTQPAEGDIALREIYAVEFRVCAVALIWLGYRRLHAASLTSAEEDVITGNLVREMDIVCEDPSSPNWVGLCEVHEQTRQNVAGKEGKDRPIIDIEIRRRRRGDHVRLRFEAKRLGRGKTIGGYLGERGMAAFFSGYYPTTHAEAGMLGYVQEQTVDFWSSKLAQEFSADQAKHRITAGGEWQSFDVEPTMPAFRSSHTDAAGKSLLVIHVLLSFVA